MNKRGSLVETKVKELLDLPLTWSAPHIQSGKDGRKSLQK